MSFKMTIWFHWMSAASSLRLGINSGTGKKLQRRMQATMIMAPDKRGGLLLPSQSRLATHQTDWFVGGLSP